MKPSQPQADAPWYWLVGEAPNHATLGHPELWMLPDGSGLMHAANRLLALTGWDHETYLRTFPQRTCAWTSPCQLWIAIGRQRATEIARKAVSDGSSGVVILGTKAASAFGLENAEPLEWVGRYAVVPHPSGRCRFWNGPDAHARGHAFFQELLCRSASAESRPSSSPARSRRSSQ